MLATKKVEKSKAKGQTESVVEAASEEPRTFSLFPKLPVELRVKIWGYASSVTRNVDIWTRALDIEQGCFYQRALYFHSSLPPPAVIHVNSESRTESLKYYDLDFGANLTISNTYSVPFTISSPNRVYFNWNTDRLCLVNPSELGNRNMLRKFSSQLVDYHRECQKKGLRYFAINIAKSALSSFCPQQHRFEEASFLKHIPRKSNLEEVILFQSSELADSDSLKINRLELEDMGSEEQGERMKYATRALEKSLKKDLEKNGDIRGGSTPLIRTCKVNVRT